MNISELISELTKALKEHGDIKIMICADEHKETTIEHWASANMIAVVQRIDWYGEDEEYLVILADI